MLWIIIQSTVFRIFRKIYSIMEYQYFCMQSKGKSTRWQRLFVKKKIIVIVFGRLEVPQWTCRMLSAQSNTGLNYEFEGIFASVVGGVSMAGGEGTVLGALVGVAIVAILRNGLNLNGINSFWQQIILGEMIVLVVFADSRRTKKRKP